MEYCRLSGSTEAGINDGGPFKCIAFIENGLSETRLETLAQSLVNEGCLYLMAAGQQAQQLIDHVGLCNHRAFPDRPIPDDLLIIATNHESEQLKDVFWFAQNTAMHPCHGLERLVVVHEGSINREAEFAELLVNL